MADHLRVLVVEDNPDSASMLARAIARGGHEVQACPDGESALAAAPEFRPDVAIVDLGLPGIDGLAVAKELRQNRLDILLIAATGRSKPEDILESRNAGCAYHLIKPLDTDEILELLEGWNQSRRRASQRN
jgi:DNA-binding response OmpR family regulator